MNKNDISEWCNALHYKPKFYGDGNPRLIVLGENHRSSKHKREQIDLLQRIKPSALIHEFARNYIYDFDNLTLSLNPAYPTPDEAIKFGQKELQRFGDTLNTKVFLEWLSNKGISQTLRKYELFAHSVDGLNTIIDSLPIETRRVIGCDISHAEMDLYQKTNGVELSSRYSQRKHHSQRENRFANAILNHLDEIQPTALTIMGNYHIKPSSQIHPILQKSGIPYVCIPQSD